MNKKDIDRLNYLIEAVSFSFIYCKDDRSRIHALEWEENNIEESVFMEVELKKTDIVATVFSIVSESIGVEEALSKLTSSSLIESDIIYGWMTKNGESYPDFKGLIHAVEHLRWDAINWCRSQNISREEILN